MVVRRTGLTCGVVLTGILVATSIGLGQGGDPWIGTWKLNVAKSTFNPGPPLQSNTLKIEVVAGAC
jgi:hypothetical protein